MTRILTKLRIDEVSSVDKGAGEGVKIVLLKRDNSDDDPPYLFDDIMKRRNRKSPFAHISLHKADVDDDVTSDHAGDTDKKLSVQLDEIVAEMIAAAPSLHPNRARRWLLHTPSGRELLVQHTTKKKETQMPQVDILKLIGVIEDGLMAQARLHKRHDESEAKAFSKLYENDIEYRKRWAALTDAKMTLSMAKKTTATMTPTFTEVGDTNVADDSAEAVRLLQEMAEQSGKSFEVVFSAPENKKLAARTYRAEQRPNVSSTSGSELQRR